VSFVEFALLWSSWVSLDGMSASRWNVEVDFAHRVTTQWGVRMLGEHEMNGRCRMPDRKTNAEDGRPSLTWVPVLDARGQTRMESRWSMAGTAAVSAPAPVTAAHHAA